MLMYSGNGDSHSSRQPDEKSRGVKVFTDETPLSLKSLLTILSIVTILNAGFTFVYATGIRGEVNENNVLEIKKELQTMQIEISTNATNTSVNSTKVRDINDELTKMDNKLTQIYRALMRSK